MDQEKCKDFAAEITTLLKLSRNGRGELTIKNKPTVDFTRQVLMELNSLKADKKLELMSRYSPLFNGTEFKAPETTRIIEAIARHLSKSAKVKLASIEGKDYSNVERPDPSMLFVVQQLDKEGKDAKRVIHRQTGEVTDISFESYLILTGAKAGEVPLVTGYLRYNPYTTERRWEQQLENIKFTVFNTHRPPVWMRAEGVEAKLPKKISDFMGHLFPIAIEREFVYDWLHHATFKRAETHLCLNGKKGVGKGFFSRLASCLVGSHNYAETKESLFTKEFNGVISERRIIYVDEVRIDKAAHTKLKKFANDMMAIESKGEDARTEKTYQSFIISNNDDTDLYVEPDDRRLSVPTLALKKLPEIFGDAWVDELDAMLRDDSIEIAQFGAWLRDRTPTHQAFDWLKGDKFHHQVFVSLPEWQKFIIRALSCKVEELRDELIEEGRLYLRRIKKVYQDIEGQKARIPISGQKIEAFLENYRYKGKYPIASIEDSEDGSILQINPAFADKVGVKYKQFDVIEPIDELDL